LTGVVYTSTVVAAAEPYQVAIVDLDNGGRATVRLEGPLARIGQRVEFIEERNGVPYYRFA
jgi:uncharacterized OB-fold protein